MSDEKGQESFAEFVAELRSKTESAAGREDYSDGLKLETWESAFDSVADEAEARLEQAADGVAQQTKLSEAHWDKRCALRGKLTREHARAVQLDKALKGLLSVVEVFDHRHETQYGECEESRIAKALVAGEVAGKDFIGIDGDDGQEYDVPLPVARKVIHATNLAWEIVRYLEDNVPPSTFDTSQEKA